MKFAFRAGFAGLAGVLFAYSEQYIAPNNFSFELSIQFLLAVAMGGRKSRVGPILGAAVVVYLPNLLADIDQFRAVAAVKRNRLQPFPVAVPSSTSGVAGYVNASHRSTPVTLTWLTPLPVANVSVG